MKYLTIFFTLLILGVASPIEAKNPNYRHIKYTEKELMSIIKEINELDKKGGSEREIKELRGRQLELLELLSTLDPDGDYSLYYPPKAGSSATVDNRKKMDVIIEEEQPKANPNEEITLTVTSDGPTKDEAVKNALRTAIEQAYGAFVSANTTILNDELVKDEIVTVSNGSIKNYKILSDYEKSDGTGYGVTANATVSLPHLITYAKNHGSECEFAGNTFGMEIKLFNLQKENELKALYNSIPQIKDVAKTYNHHTLNIHEPKLISYSFNVNYSEKPIYGYIQAKGELLIDNDYEFGLRNYGFYMLNKPVISSNGPQVEKDAKAISCFEALANEQNVLVEFDIYWEKDEANTLCKTIMNLLTSLSVDDDAFDRYKSLGLAPCEVDLSDYFVNHYDPVYGYRKFKLRNSHKEFALWCDSLRRTINAVSNNFVITDNSRQISDFAPLELINACMPYLISDYSTVRYFFQYPYLEEPALQYLKNNQSFEYCYSTKTGRWKWYADGRFNYCFHIPNKLYKFRTNEIFNEFGGSFSLQCIGASGVFSNLFYLKCFAPIYINLGNKRGLEHTVGGILWKAYAVIPLSEIGKYSSFKIEPKE